MKNTSFRKGPVRGRLTLDWNIAELSILVDKRLTSEACRRAATTIARRHDEATEVAQVRRLLDFLVPLNDVVISAAFESSRFFDMIALECDDRDLQLQFDEVHMSEIDGSIDVYVQLDAKLARRMIRGELRRASRESGSPIATDALAEPSESQYSEVLSSRYLPNAAAALASLPTSLMVDRVIDVALNEYEKTVALHDPTRRNARFGPLHNPGWHATPSNSHH